MTSMLEPDLKPSPAREIAHRGKGCLAVIVAAAVLVVGGYVFWDKASSLLTGFGEVPDFSGPGQGSVTISIPEGTTVSEMGTVLVENNVVKSEKAWAEAVASEPRASSIQAGRYRMRTEIPAAEALSLLINPGESRIRAQFTVLEGLRLTAQVDQLVEETKISEADFEAALDQPEKLGLPDYAKNRPEGFLFPDTYELIGDATATSILQLMIDRYKTVTDEMGLEVDAKALKKTPYEVLTVASIIEREVNSPECRAKVSRVLYNRLEQDKKLELDSTVTYARNLNTTTTTDKDRQSKSKYNTYRYKGLPPGPISAPGRAALQAAGNPEEGDWLFFVTVNLDTGETKFAETFAEHEENVAEFQAWCQANKGRCT